ncbi:MAG: hypothetical protein EON52_12805 [Actinomycetales bacterium]|nr:MAG: hypothetical protein EON52_12805 [Actinomycetales bacterium]
MAVVLVVVGVLAILLQPGPPDGECVPDGTPSSGFTDSDSGCAISQESYDKIADYNSSPKPFRIVGLVLILAGIVVGVVTLVRRRRSGPSGSPAP